MVGKEVAGGGMTDDGIPEHGADAITGALEGDIFFGVGFAGGDVTGSDDTLAGYGDVGTFGLGNSLDTRAESAFDVAHGGNHVAQFIGFE